ncbi:hypothetical protein ASG47_07175 [Devosia sp. Leaf420]|nr:hypothetical protein ASG47_07175 [Devosia sp. Leaf420]
MEDTREMPLAPHLLERRFQSLFGSESQLNSIQAGQRSFVLSANPLHDQPGVLVEEGSGLMAWSVRSGLADFAQESHELVFRSLFNLPIFVPSGPSASRDLRRVPETTAAPLRAREASYRDREQRKRKTFVVRMVVLQAIKMPESEPVSPELRGFGLPAATRWREWTALLPDSLEALPLWKCYHVLHRVVHARRTLDEMELARLEGLIL